MQQRCTFCRKLLAVGTGRFTIKCPRCKAVNHFDSPTNLSTASAVLPSKGAK